MAQCLRSPASSIVAFACGRDVGVHGLSEQAVRHADDGRLADARRRVEDLLDLARDDLLAARLDQVVVAPDEVEVPLLVAPEEIAGREHALPRPAAGPQPLALSLGVVPVALHHVRAPDHQLADLARAERRCRRSSSIQASVPGIGMPTDVGRASIWSGGR